MKNDLFRAFPAIFERDSERIWRAVFWILLFCYCIFYAPVGLNETDGGFLTGLAWQLQNGKNLYSEIVYVRPPMSVWLRFLELKMLGDGYPILAERVLFYLKIGLSSWLAAVVLTAEKERRWLVATLSFVVSCHAYPPMAWHTVDGVLLAAASLYFLKIARHNSFIIHALAGFLAVGAMLCKQSFFPFAAVFLGLLFLKKWTEKRAVFGGVFGFAAAIAAFLFWLKSTGAWADYFFWTAGALTADDALKSGFFDFFRIQKMPLFFGLGGAVAGFSVGSIFFKKEKLGFAWIGFLAGLILSYLFSVLKSAEFLAPFGQARLLFWLGLLGILFQIKENLRVAGILANVKTDDGRTVGRDYLLSLIGFDAIALLAVTWMSAISWGYNLPILFSAPMVFGCVCLFEKLFFSYQMRLFGAILAVFSLVFVFRIGYEDVYRDGQRGEMTAEMGAVFPRLAGIRSDSATFKKYASLKKIAAELPEKNATLVVLPSFPLADYLLSQRPVLPLDWESSLETNGHNSLIINVLEKEKPLILIEKSYGSRLEKDSIYTIAKWAIERGERIGETDDFLILRLPNAPPK